MLGKLVELSGSTPRVAELEGQLKKAGDDARAVIRDVLAALRRAEEERDHLRTELQGCRSTVQGFLSDAQKLAAERDLLRAKLTAHHAMHHMSEWDVARWAASTENICPVCKEVEDARAAGEQRRRSD